MGRSLRHSCHFFFRLTCQKFMRKTFLNKRVVCGTNRHRCWYKKPNHLDDGAIWKHSQSNSSEILQALQNRCRIPSEKFSIQNDRQDCRCSRPRRLRRRLLPLGECQFSATGSWTGWAAAQRRCRLRKASACHMPSCTHVRNSCLLVDKLIS